MVFSDVGIFCIRCVALIYDIISLPIYLIVQNPWKTLRQSKMIRAKQESKEDPKSAWVFIETKKPSCRASFLLDFKSVDEAIKQCINFHGRDKTCFAYRKVLNEELVKGDDGKMIKKYALSDYHWITYGDLDIRIDNIARGLLVNGVKPRDVVLIFAETRIEW